MGQKTKLIYIAVIAIAVILLAVPMITQNHTYISVTQAPDTLNSFLPAMHRVIGGESLQSMIAGMGRMPYIGLA